MRQRQEIQAVPRQAGLITKLPASHVKPLQQFGAAFSFFFSLCASHFTDGVGRCEDDLARYCSMGTAPATKRSE
ncbi:hypothetical protein PQR63_12740 [Herbaspirillum rhizosphaerae]|uniref:Uncharacterized protein n=1 Tax=Herbaspirillum rhizosphaerae TaxID=346179 RepID=A0ABW8Z8I5_9BURK